MDKKGTPIPGGALCSLISNEIYPGYGYSTIQAVPNFYDEQEKSIMVTVFGLEDKDTDKAVDNLKAIIKGRTKLEISNRSESYPAIVIKRVDGSFHP